MYSFSYDKGMKFPKRYLEYLIGFYHQCGLDIDYIKRLNADEIHYMCVFILENYGGMTDDIVIKKRANHHRYATQNDAHVRRSIPLSEVFYEQSYCTPESYLITAEGAERRLKKIVRRKICIKGVGGR